MTSLPIFMQNDSGGPFPVHSMSNQGMDRPGVRQVPEGSEELGNMEKRGCKIICSAPTTRAVKGLLMLMMILGVTLQRYLSTTSRDQRLKTLLKSLLDFLSPPLPLRKQLTKQV